MSTDDVIAMLRDDGRLDAASTETLRQVQDGIEREDFVYLRGLDAGPATGVADGMPSLAVLLNRRLMEVFAAPAGNPHYFPAAAGAGLDPRTRTAAYISTIMGTHLRQLSDDLLDTADRLLGE